MATQSEWNRQRAARKAEADKVVQAAAEKAAADLRDYRKRQVATARGAEPQVDQDSERSYDDYTVAELADFLKERELPHSGTKQELIDRLTESDATQGDGSE